VRLSCNGILDLATEQVSQREGTLGGKKTTTATLTSGMAIASDTFAFRTIITDDLPHHMVLSDVSERKNP
jgi:hypothetical protein